MGQAPLTPTGIQGGGMYVDVKLDTALNIGLFAFVLPVFTVMATSEYLHLHIPYSKFASEDMIQELPGNAMRKAFQAQIASRTGMFFIYIVPLLSYVILWAVYAGQNMARFGQVAPSPTYSILLFVGWMMSFSKRVFEVLFVHIYSGTIPIASSISISLGYSAAGLVTCVFANQVVGYDVFGPQTVVKDVICILFFLVGIIVNFIAHYQLRLARLRPSEEGKPKRYMAPGEIGWLFKVFICPHYVFEIIMFAAWCIFGATCVHYCVGVGVAGYLSGRTRSTYKWYQSKGLIGSGAVSNENKELSSTVIPSTSPTKGDV